MTHLLTMQETAAHLRVSRATLYRWIKEGRIFPRRVGSQHRFSEQEIERFTGGEHAEVAKARTA